MKTLNLILFKIIFSLFILICVSNFLFLINPTKAANTTYYIDNACAYNGDGTNQNCAESVGAVGPFNSLANARVKIGGYGSDDKVLLKKGEVFEEKFIFPSSGTVGHSITLGSYGSGAKPVINSSSIITDWKSELGYEVGSSTVIFSKSINTQVDDVFEDGLPMRKATDSNCSDGTWFWDSAAKILYYKPTNGSADSHVVAYVQPSFNNFAAIDVSNKSNITIDGLAFVNFNSGILGIDSSAANSNIIIQNCDFNYGVNAIYFQAGAHGDSAKGQIKNNSFYRVGRAIGTYVTTGNATYKHNGWVISNNEMNQVGTYDGLNHWYGIVDFEAIGVQNFQNGTISDNYIHDGNTRGVFLYGNSGGVCSTNVITRNKFYNTKAPAFLTMGDGAWGWSGNIFSYNILWNTGSPDIGTDDSFAIQVNQGSSAKTINYIINNVIYGGSQDLIYLYRGTAEYLTIENNILGNFSRSAIYLSSVNGPKTNLVVNYNIYDVDGGFYYNDALRNLAYIKTNAKWEAKGVVANPMFANAATGNFTLLSTSPAIETGVNLGTSYKMGLSPNSSALLDQTANSSLWDIGPYVYNELTPPIISNGKPSGTLVATTTSAILSVTTNKPATCKYSTSTNVIYESMANTFKNSNGTTYTTTVNGLTRGSYQQYYVRCSDSKKNTNLEDYTISFLISPDGPTNSNSGNSNNSNTNSGNGGTSTGTVTSYNHDAPTQFVAQTIGNDVEIKWKNPSSSKFTKTSLYRTTSSISVPSFESLSSKANLIYNGTDEKYVDKNRSTSLPGYYYIFSRFGDNLNSSILTKNVVFSPTSNSNTTNNNSNSNSNSNTITNANSKNENKVKDIVTLEKEAKDIAVQAGLVNLDYSSMQLYDKLFKNNQEKVKVLSKENRYAVAFFIQNGTPSVVGFGSGERAGIINSYAKAFGKFPRTEPEWGDLIKSANGRWPVERNKTTEEAAKIIFQKIYKRGVDTNNIYDNNAISVIAYGLRPQTRDLSSEKIAIISFKNIFGHGPSSVSDWDSVRAIAYSGAKR